MWTRGELRTLLTTGTLSRTSKVKSQESGVERLRREVVTFPRASRAVTVVHGRSHDRVDYLVVPDGVADEVLAAEGLTLRDLAAIEGVQVAPYVPHGVSVVRTIWT